MEPYQLDDIELRRYERKDAKALYEAVRESIESTYPFQAWCRPDYSIKDATAWGLHAHRGWARGENYLFLVGSVSTQRIVGTASLFRLDREHGVAEAGYFVRESMRGQGIAPIICKLLWAYGLDHLHLNRLEFLVATHNAPSLRVMQKIGAHYEGLLKNRLKWNDQFFDANLYVFPR